LTAARQTFSRRLRAAVTVLDAPMPCRFAVTANHKVMIYTGIILPAAGCTTRSQKAGQKRFSSRMLTDG